MALPGEKSAFALRKHERASHHHQRGRRRVVAVARAGWPVSRRLLRFDLLENVVGCRMPTVDVLRPAKQSWSPGDKLWMYPPEGAGGAGFATLRSYVPGRALGFGTRVVGTPITAPEDGSWTFVLQPLDGYTTRLLIRGRGPVTRSWLGLAFDRSIFEPVHFVLERRMMIGISRWHKGQGSDPGESIICGCLWTITFACSRVRWQVLRRRDGDGRCWFAGVAAGVWY